jgi:hypothetical protein
MKTSMVLIGLLLMLALSAQGSMVLWNTLGSDSEVTHSEVGPNGVIVGTVDYLPAQDGNGFKPQPISGDPNIPNNFVDFQNLPLGQRGSIEFWYWADWVRPYDGVRTIMHYGLEGEPYTMTMEYNDWQDRFYVVAGAWDLCRPFSG